MLRTASMLLAALVTSPSLAEDAADLVLRGGVFYPVSSPGSIAGSLAIRDGRIVALGMPEEVARLVGPETRVIELAGRAVTPGFVDAHAHLASLGRSLEQVDLVGTTSFDEVVDRLRSAAASVPAGEWILGRGWDQNDWAYQEFPRHRRLSLAVPDHPVWVVRVDGHAGLLNARAMTELDLDADVADPMGGRLLRDPNGDLTGVVVDTAMDLVARGVPAATPAQRRRWLELAGAHCVARGLTTVTDMGVDEELYDAYRSLRDSDALPLRGALFLGDETEFVDTWLQRGPEIDPSERLLVRGIKLYADGALGSRGAALIEPYADDPGNLGLLTSTSEHLADVCARALEAGFQVGIHAIGDRGALLALDAFETCFGGPRPEARFRLEHAQVMRLQDIRRMAKLGIIASMQPTHATSDMPWAEQRLGPERLIGAYAWRRVLSAGGRLALGSDFPVEKADPLLGFYAAITRRDLAGQPPGGWLSDQLLTREEALRGFTLDAAFSLFMEHEVGSLEPGKRADLVVFSRDPMVVPAAEISAIAVDLTVVDGEIVFDRGKEP